MSIEKIKRFCSSNKRVLIIVVAGIYISYLVYDFISTQNKISSSKETKQVLSVQEPVKYSDSNLKRAPRRDEAINKHILNKVDVIDNKVADLEEKQDIKAINELSAKLIEIEKKAAEEKAASKEEAQKLRDQLEMLSSTMIDAIANKRQVEENHYGAGMDEEDNGVKVIKLNLSKQKINKPIKLTDNTIPNQTLAEGVIVVGAWAGSGSNAAGNPEPVSIKLTSDGIAPGDENVTLKGCTVAASLYGDLSSRRAIVRLNQLICPTGDRKEIITQIAGTVVGAEGKAGIRGNVSLENQEYIANAIAGGTLSGLGKNLNNDNTKIFNPFTSQESDVANKNSFSQRLGNALAGSAGNAVDGVGQMYLDIAKTITPIIAIDAGQKVNIIFLHTAFEKNITIKKDLENEKN